MAKYTAPTRVPRAGDQIATHEGGRGFKHGPKTELYIGAISTMNEDTFYETKDARNERLAKLSQEVGVLDPDWVLRFVTYLRDEANLRSVGILVACEAVFGRLRAGLVGYNRQLISAVCQRADEPGQVLTYWLSSHGRNIPMPVKRGVADAAKRLFTERAALRYDGGSVEMRLADVIELVHPKPIGPAQAALFGWLLDRRHGRRETPEAALKLLSGVTARTRLNAMSVFERHELAFAVLSGDPVAEVTFRSALAGQWEWGKSWLGQETEDKAVARLMEADQWELFLSHGMGYMATLRNLRNFDQADIKADLRMQVHNRLVDPDEVARSRQLPFRFYSAYRATGGTSWEKALAQALDLAVSNVPELGGRTLVMVDMSGSMWWGNLSNRSDIKRAHAAALFGSVFARRCEAVDLIQFGSSSQTVEIDRRESVLKSMDRFTDMGGTYTATAVKRHYHGHDRVILFSDEQAHDGDVGAQVPEEVPIYTWNLGGYTASHAAGPNRHVFGGLSDAAFSLIPAIEAGADGEFPF